MPDAQKMLPILRRASLLSRATHGRRGSLIMLDDSAEDVMVVGDLHGNLLGLKNALQIANLDGNPNRHLVLQELVHGKRRYPDDGGERSHELVDVVAVLKCQYPQRVHIILGNHELAEITGRLIIKGGEIQNHLFRQGVNTAYGAYADEMFGVYQEFFRSLPIAVVTPNRVMVCHTIPNADDLDHFKPEVLQSGRWTDEDMARHGTIYSITWGRDTEAATLDRFSSMVNADWFVTGHQPCPESGFRKANHRQIIIDGTGNAPAYCLFPAYGPVTIDAILANTDLARSSSVAKPTLAPQTANLSQTAKTEDEPAEDPNDD